jgi:type-F conjugative transfer system pilin assembly protein TrbC
MMNVLKYAGIALTSMWLSTAAAQEKQAAPETDKSPLQQKYEDQYKSMVKEFTGAIEDKSHPMVKRAETAYEDYKSSPVGTAFFDAINEKTEGAAEKKGVLIFFISSSMPVHTIKGYMAQAEKINTHIMFAIRGTTDNSLRLMPTLQYLKELKSYSGCGKSLCQRELNTVIDPRLFEQYGISEVPALAYTTEFSNQGYFDNQTLPGKTNPTVVVGEATLPFLVKTLSEEIDDENLTAIAQTYSF